MGKPVVHIRGAQESDALAVLAIWKQEARWLGNGGLAWKRFWESTSGGEEWIVACIGANVVGFAHFRNRKDGWRTLYEIAVDGVWRGQGIGRSLVRAIRTPIRLKTNWDNEVSNAFYLALGFRPAGKTQSLKGKIMNVWERHEEWAGE